MSAIAGLLTLNSGPSTNEWVSEYQEGILVRNAKGYNSGATLFGLMSRLKSEPAETTEFAWFERDPVTRMVYTDGGNLLNNSTSLTFDNGSGGSVDGILQVGCVLRNDRTGEYILLTTRTSGTVFVAARNFPTNVTGGTGTALADNDTWTVVTKGSNPVVEAEQDAATGVFETASILTNYIQTFKSTVNLQNAFKASKLRTDLEGPLKERRVQALERVARDIELAYLFGHARAAATGGWFTGGIKHAVDQLGSSSYYGTSANVLNGNGTSGTLLANVNDWLASFMTVGSESKIAFAGPQAYAAISTFANQSSNGFRITGAESVFGMNITTIQTPFGAIDLAMHPLMKEISAFNDWMIVADLGLLIQKVMEPLFLEPNIQTPGSDTYKEQFRAKYGLKLKFAQAFGYAYDLSVIL